MKVHILNKAIKLASELPLNKQRVCAIITTRQWKILSIGFNSFTKTAPKQKYFAFKANQPSKKYLHGEIHALLRCRSDKAYAIYVARVDRFGRPLFAKPCPVCQFAIAESNIREINYT
jgi:deoxycytidylate deaminase